MFRLKLETIKNPEIYIPSPDAQNLFFQENLSAPVENSFALFSAPNQLKIITDNKIKKSLLLENFPENQKPISMRSYNKNLYFLMENNRIIKYPYSGNLEWEKPELWLKNETEQTNLDAKSMAIDTSIWILNRNNESKNYHNGVYRKTLEMNIFPDTSG